MQVVVTRSKHQSKNLLSLLKKVCIQAVHTPSFEIIYTCDPEELKEFSEGDWAFFTSANSVRAVAEYLPRGMNTAVVGRKTAKCLEELYAPATFIPEHENAKSLAEEFVSNYNYDSKIRYVLFEGSTSLPDLRLGLESADFLYSRVVSYQVEKAQWDLVEAECLKRQGNIFTFYSPLSIQFFLSILDTFDFSNEVRKEMSRAPLLVVGAKTQEFALSRGFQNVHLAVESSDEAILDLILAHK